MLGLKRKSSATIARHDIAEGIMKCFGYGIRRLFMVENVGGIMTVTGYISGKNDKNVISKVVDGEFEGTVEIVSSGPDKRKGVYIVLGIIFLIFLLSGGTAIYFGTQGRKEEKLNPWGHRPLGEPRTR